MKKLILAIGFATVATFANAFEDDIQSTINQQLDALKADNFDQAFTYASPFIQNMFGTSDNFGLMVQRGYPMVWRPDDVRFLELRNVGNLQWQRVQIKDAAGVIHTLDYQMINIDGAWRINGVQLIEAPQVGV